MSKSLKIEIPENLDFNVLVKNTIDTLLQDKNDKNLIAEHRKILEKLH